MKSPRSQAKRHTYAFPWFLDLSDDPVFGGCLAREPRSSGSARWISGQPGPPPQYHPASSNISSQPPRNRSGHPSKIGSGPNWTPTNARDIPQKSHLGPKMAQDGPQMALRWPKMTPRWPKMAQDGSKMAPRWPKMALRWPKTDPR